MLEGLSRFHAMVAGDPFRTILASPVRAFKPSYASMRSGNTTARDATPAGEMAFSAGLKDKPRGLSGNHHSMLKTVTNTGCCHLQFRFTSCATLH